MKNSPGGGKQAVVVVHAAYAMNTRWHKRLDAPMPQSSDGTSQACLFLPDGGMPVVEVW